MLYSECHQGQHHHCLHSLKITSHFVQPISCCLFSRSCLLAQFTLVVALFVIYQPSCQGVTTVSPSPPVGGTPCRLSTSFTLNGQIPLTKLYGVTPDISILMIYTFYQSVYYASHNQSYPSTSEEKHAFWVGFGEHEGF